MMPGDEAVAFMLASIYPRSLYHPSCAKVRRHIAAIRKAQADIGLRAVGFPLDAGDAFLVNMTNALRADIAAMELRNDERSRVLVVRAANRILLAVNGVMQ